MVLWSYQRKSLHLLETHTKVPTDVVIKLLFQNYPGKGYRWGNRQNVHFVEAGNGYIRVCYTIHST